TLGLQVDGERRDVLLYQVLTLLDWLGSEVERLRCCPAPDCRKLFVKIGRREFCAVRCQQRVFQKNYDPFAAERAGRSSRRRDGNDTGAQQAPGVTPRKAALRKRRVIT